MDKNGILTIGKWFSGMAQYPLAGFGMLRNLEIHDQPGIAKLTTRMIASSIIFPDTMPIAMDIDTTGDVYTACGYTVNGSVFQNGSDISGGALSDITDIKIFKDYLWIRHNQYLSAYGPLSNSPQMFSNIVTGLDAFWIGKLLVGQDGYLYTGNGNYVARLDPLTLGTPTVSPTFDYTPIWGSVTNGDGSTSPAQTSGFTNLTALNLPDGNYVCTLEELGKNIMVGCSGGSSYADRVNHPRARIYPWNRQLGTLGDPGLADMPVIFNENGLHAMIQYSNALYVVAGTQGNVYKTDGTTYVKIARIPFRVTGELVTMKAFYNAIAISPEGRLLIGSSSGADSFPGSTSTHGVWEIDIHQKGYPIHIKKTVSTGGIGQTTALQIGTLYSLGLQSLYIGFSEGTGGGGAQAYSYGVDREDIHVYEIGYIETELFPVGTYQSKKTFEHMEFGLASRLAVGQSLVFYYRLSTSDAYTLITGTYDFASLGNVLSTLFDSTVADAQYVQFKIELHQNISTAIYGSNVSLASLRLS